MDFDNRNYQSLDESEAIGVTEFGSKSAGVSGQSIVPVILSGGAGSRLWPYSTEEAPKQFLSITGSKSLFRLTLDRVRDRKRFESPVIVGNVRHADLCKRELEPGEGARLILEPCARNTAAAITMAAEAVRQSDGEDALILVMPSDHVIDDVAAFLDGIETGESAARAGHLVTFGIRPSCADTGFGYLRTGDDLAGSVGVKRVAQFVEKPSFDLAAEMVADGRHLWNAGIFLFRAGTFLEEVRLHAPGIAAAAERAIERGSCEGDSIVADQESFEACPSESVDYAVMEHSSRVVVVPISPGWSDLGSWDALAQLLESAAHGPVTALECDDCYIRSDGLQVAALGVRDLIIVASGQRLLILPRGRSQEVKKLLTAMQSMAA